MNSPLLDNWVRFIDEQINRHIAAVERNNEWQRKEPWCKPDDYLDKRASDEQLEQIREPNHE